MFFFVKATADALFSHSRCEIVGIWKTQDHGKLRRAERQTAVVLHQQLLSVNTHMTTVCIFIYAEMSVSPFLKCDLKI